MATWKDNALAATRGTQLGAIIACALNVERDATPRFVGNACVTSDGFMTCNFVDRNGAGHLGAFVSAVPDLAQNVRGLAEHLHLDAPDCAALFALVQSWIATDYRSNARPLSAC